MVWYGMVNVDLYSAIITKVSNALIVYRYQKLLKSTGFDRSYDVMALYKYDDDYYYYYYYY